MFDSLGINPMKKEIDRDCTFCKIIVGKLPCKQIYEDDLAIAISDINPVAKVHVLIIPKLHITSLCSLTAWDEKMLGHLIRVAANVSKTLGVKESGYRVLVNQGQDAGQLVEHLHFHVIGGQPLHSMG